MRRDHPPLYIDFGQAWSQFVGDRRRCLGDNATNGATITELQIWRIYGES